jgi:hypothetical protein
MNSTLQHLIFLLKKAESSADQSSYVLTFSPNVEDLKLLKAIHEKGGLEQLSVDGNVLDLEEVSIGSAIDLELVQHTLQGFGYYHDFQSFINANEYQSPQEFYIRILNFEYPSTNIDTKVRGYFAAINLIESLSPLTLFQSDDTVTTIYLMQDKYAVALPLIYGESLFSGKQPNLDKISQFVSELSGHSERRKIYTKELIDFLNIEPESDLRFIYLFLNFDSFYQKCEAAYAFFLSDFSYNKLKLELESAILDYSKNIRTIINDAQTKLIAIPAAFLVASSQLNLEKSISLKNILIVFSSFVFSTLIEVFIRNQESAVKIFKDNIITYKTSFKLKNHTTDLKESQTLQTIITASFQAIDDELKNQEKRISLIRYINWGMSVFLVIVIIGLLITEVLSINFSSTALLILYLISFRYLT